MSNLRRILELEKDHKYAFMCPGCHVGHQVLTPPWQYSGDEEKPTIIGSVLIHAEDPSRRCHSTITAGQITFLSDCHHILAGKTVDLPLL